MINDQRYIDQIEQAGRLHRAAVEASEEWRRQAFEHIRAYNELVTERDNLREEMRFIRQELGEDHWERLVYKYERENASALLVKAGLRVGGGA